MNGYDRFMVYVHRRGRSETYCGSMNNQGEYLCKKVSTWAGGWTRLIYPALEPDRQLTAKSVRVSKWILSSGFVVYRRREGITYRNVV